MLSQKEAEQAVEGRTHIERKGKAVWALGMVLERFLQEKTSECQDENRIVRATPWKGV